MLEEVDCLHTLMEIENMPMSSIHHPLPKHNKLGVKLKFNINIK
jgi:hypothetical protein